MCPAAVNRRLGAALSAVQQVQKFALADDFDRAADASASAFRSFVDFSPSANCR